MLRKRLKFPKVDDDDDETSETKSGMQQGAWDVEEGKSAATISDRLDSGFWTRCILVSFLLLFKIISRQFPPS